MDAAFLSQVFSIIVIDLVLSGDNAVVIALAVKNLPPEMARRATIWGAGGAVILRVIFASLAAMLLGIPLLQAVGGGVLFWIAWKLMNQEGEGGDAPEKSVTQFREAVQTIILADVVMSLDNILAVGGASHGNLKLLLFGLAVSIPLVLWGCTLLTTLLRRVPALVYVGAGVLVWTATKMIVEDAIIKPLIEPHLPEWLLSPGSEIIVTSVFIGLGLLVARRKKAAAPAPVTSAD